MAAEISRAGPDRVATLVDVLARSFADDPIVRWPFPTDGSVVEQCRELFRILDERFAHTGWLWEADDGAGVAMWVPPGAAQRFVEIELETRDPIDAMTGDEGVRYRGFWDWIEAHLPPEPHWFLDHLAVAPERRGEGLGVALVELGTGFARRDGVPAFLETARLMTYELAKNIDRGVDLKVQHAQCSMAKLYASEMAGRVADRAVQIFGGRGYMRENVAERFWREVRVDRIWEGTSEIQRNIVADQLAKRGARALAG